MIISPISNDATLAYMQLAEPEMGRDCQKRTELRAYLWDVLADILAPRDIGEVESTAAAANSDVS